MMMKKYNKKRNKENNKDEKKEEEETKQKNKKNEKINHFFFVHLLYTRKMQELSSFVYSFIGIINFFFFLNLYFNYIKHKYTNKYSNY